MKNESSDPKILKNRYIPTSEFYSQIIDSLQDYSIFTLDKEEEDKIVVQIRDTGIGMSKELQEKLFTPQRNSSSKMSKGKKGSGIGLLLVKGFLETNGGEIWVESTEGKGSS